MDRILALLQEEAFVSRLAGTASYRQAEQLFAEKGVALSAAAFDALRARLKSVAEGELTDDELALVAGGFPPELASGTFMMAAREMQAFFRVSRNPSLSRWLT